MYYVAAPEAGALLGCATFRKSALCGSGKEFLSRGKLEDRRELETGGGQFFLIPANYHVFRYYFADVKKYGLRLRVVCGDWRSIAHPPSRLATAAMPDTLRLIQPTKNSFNVVFAPNQKI